MRRIERRLTPFERERVSSIRCVGNLQFELGEKAHAMKKLRLLMISLVVASCAARANAAAIIVAYESNGGIVINGSGTLNLAQLSFRTDGTTIASGFFGTPPSTTVGPARARVANYVGPSLRGPSRIGDLNSFARSDGGAGDFFGISFFYPPRAQPTLVTPENYASGEPLAGSSFYANRTLADLGIERGTYVWTWGLGAQTDSLTLRVVPEPASLTLCAIALLAATWSRKPASSTNGVDAPLTKLRIC